MEGDTDDGGRAVRASTRESSRASAAAARTRFAAILAEPPIAASGTCGGDEDGSDYAQQEGTDGGEDDGGDGAQGAAKKSASRKKKRRATSGRTPPTTPRVSGRAGKKKRQRTASEESADDDDDDDDLPVKSSAVRRKSVQGKRLRVSPSSSSDDTARDSPDVPSGAMPPQKKKARKSPAAGIASDRRPPRPSRVSSAHDQPEWSEMECTTLRRIVNEGKALGRKQLDSYAAYNVYIAEHHPDWHQRSHGACQGILKRERSQDEKKKKWLPEEIAFVSKLRGEGFSYKAIAAKHKKEFADQKIVRTPRGLREKMAMCQGQDPDAPDGDDSSDGAASDDDGGGDGPPPSGDDIRVDSPLAAPAGGGVEARDETTELTSSRRLWTTGEDAVVRAHLKKVSPNLAKIKVELDVHRARRVDLSADRSLQAIRSRINVLKSGKTITYRRRTLWGQKEDDLLKSVMARKYSTGRIVGLIERRTGAMPTFIRRRIHRFRREERERDAESEGQVAGEVPDTTAEDDSDADPREAADLRPSRPDAWLDSDYYVSGLSASEDDGEEVEEPVKNKGEDAWAPTTPSLTTTERTNAGELTSQAAGVEAEGEEVIPARPTQVSRLHVVLCVPDVVRAIIRDLVERVETRYAGQVIASPTYEEAEQAVEEEKQEAAPTGDVVQMGRQVAVSPRDLDVDASGLTPPILIKVLNDDSASGELPSSTDAVDLAHEESGEVEVEGEPAEQGDDEAALRSATFLPKKTPEEAIREEGPSAGIDGNEAAATEPAPSKNRASEKSEEAECHKPADRDSEDVLGELVNPGAGTAVIDPDLTSQASTTSDLTSQASPAIQVTLAHTSEQEDEVMVDVTNEDELKGNRWVGPLSPLRSVDEGATTAQDWASVRDYHLRYQNKRTGRTVMINSANYEKIWISNLDPRTSVYELVMRFINRTSEREGDRTDWVHVERGDTFKPKLTCRLKSLVFVATLLRRDDAALLIWLREMWVTDYGMCRDPGCCLIYDVTRPGYEHTGICRHWEYFHKRRVHLDRFKDEKDYLLAMALSVHRDAFDDTANEGQEPKVGWTYKPLQIRAYGMASKMVAGWPAGAKAAMTDHVMPLFGVLSAIVLSDDASDLEGRGDFFQPWDYGKLYYNVPDDKSKPDRRRLGWCFIFQADKSWIILTSAPCEAIRLHLTEMEWSARGNVGNYVRRLEAIERATKNPGPMIRLLAQRDTTLTPRSPDVRQRAVGTRLCTQVARQLDSQQYEVVRRALTQTGIVLARGPYGCGKTTLITKLVLAYLAAHSGDRIAIVSEANTAIDEDLERLIHREGMCPPDIVRIGLPRDAAGRQIMPPDSLRPAYVKCVCDDLRESLKKKGIEKQARERQVKEKEFNMINRARVVVTTLSQLGKEVHARQRFNLVINDEGAQTLEASLLQAMGWSVEVLVSVGDPDQLLAYSPLDERYRYYFLGEDRRHKLIWSVIHAMHHASHQRTGNPMFPGVTMTAEFRSHEKITRFLAPYYDYPLRDRARRSDDYLQAMELPSLCVRDDWIALFPARRPPDTQLRVQGERVVWLSPVRSLSTMQIQARKHPDAPDSKTPEACNLVNLVEAVAVVDLLLRIRETLRVTLLKITDAFAKQPRKTVLIISPYKSQVLQIEKLLRDYRNELEEYMSYEVKTTDSSQGKEAEIVIASFVRNQTLGFLSGYPARSLVSLSRGKDYLFILGCHRTLEMDAMWRRLMKVAEELKVPRGELLWTASEAGERAYATREEYRQGRFPTSTVPMAESS